VPALLAKDFVVTAYKEACDEKNWSFLRGEGEFLLQPARTGNVVLVQGSATVAGAGGSGGMVFATTDIGRQVRALSAGPPLTIIDVDTAGDTSATLERAWDGDSSSSAPMTVSDIYATCPADFGHFVAVLDPQMQRQIRVFNTTEELNKADPGRMSTGQPWALVNYRLSALASTLGRVQYEWWPYFNSASTVRFPFYYMKRPATPADDDYFQGPLRERADAIIAGALAMAAEWPGTAEERNPYFNLQLAQRHRDRFRYEVGLLEVKDEETYLTWWREQPASGMSSGALAPQSADYMQSHE
jgi:hypothetical protein